MKKEDFVYLCTIVGNLSGIPARLYQDDQLIFFHNTVRLPKDPVLLAQKDIPFPNGHILFRVTSGFFYFGIVTGGPYQIVIGPSRQTAAQDQELRDMAFELNLSSDDTADFLTGMKQIVRLPLESIGAKSFVEKVGGYTVLTTTRNYATPLQLAGAGNQSPRIRRDHEDHAGTVQI